MNLKVLWKLYLRAGLDKEEYRRLIPSVRKENRALLEVFSQLAAVMFFALFIASVVSNGFATVNSPTYMTCALVMLLILLCVRFLVPKRPSLVMPLVYLFEIVLFAFGIHVSMLHMDKPAVSAVAFLLVSPLLFYDLPVRLSGLVTVVIAVFCVMVARFKEQNVAETDVWNMITFGIVAIAVTIYSMRTKYRALSQSRQIEYMSQTDLLTGVKNRNHYESQLQQYPAQCREKLACVYADVNGLHEVNNRQGHPAGDEMLRQVAVVMQQHFGQEHTFRVGGDEFVAFRPEGEEEAVTAELEEIRRILEAKGYHVSLGLSVQEKTQGELNMAELVKEAENRMFADKRAFYSRPGNNRRSR